jgi:hypothetical protein
MEIKFACLEVLMTSIVAQVKSNVPILDKFKKWKYSPSFNLNFMGALEFIINIH